MIQQYLKQLMPSVKAFDEITGKSTDIDYIDVMEVTPETTCHIAKHEGEDGQVFADTRVRLPARFRAVIAFPRIENGALTDEQQNLLDASFDRMKKYTVTSYFSRCWNMAVVSSRNRDTPDMQGLRLQEVMFEECLVYGKAVAVEDPESEEDSGTETSNPQNAG